MEPKHFLRLEGLALLAAAVCAYWLLQGSWVLFAVLFLAPDLGLLGYIRDAKLGALTYNLCHFEAWPLIVLTIAYFASSSVLGDIGLIWLAHIGFDRALGIGLKYRDKFSNTHLGSLPISKKD